MQLTNNNGVLTLQADTYRLVFNTARPFVDLETVDGELIAELFIFSAVHPLSGRDDTYDSGVWWTDEWTDKIIVMMTAKSTAWTSKTYAFHCLPTRFTYDITVEGNGVLTDVEYFGGHYSGSLRWGSGYYWSGQEFTQIFNPEPNIPEVYHLPPGSGTKIDMTGVPIPAKGDWFFTPPPFVFAGQYKSGWLGMGVEAQPGENTYTEFGYHGNLEAFYLSLAYEGHTEVKGAYKLPAISFDFVPDEYSAIKVHVESLRQSELVVTPAAAKKPSWWRSPIFCAWGPQCYLANIGNGRAPDYARQEHYETFLAVLAEQRLDPGIVVLDDKWQAHYGDNSVDENKWPDLRGFVDQQHAQNRKVLLWLKAWDPDGIPVDECVLNAGGGKVAVDVTNPVYEERLRASVRRMLSAEGYDADGFKIDFTARIPSGYGMTAHDNSVWGIELMRKYLLILYSEAKRVKADALIMAHTPHPYLADVVDMIRLNDMNTEPGKDINRAMRHRAKVASAAIPEAIIDTDNWPIRNKADWRSYIQIQNELGVPSLYCVTHIDSTQEPLDAEDYELIRQVWAQSRAQYSS